MSRCSEQSQPTQNQLKFPINYFFQCTQTEGNNQESDQEFSSETLFIIVAVIKGMLNIRAAPFTAACSSVVHTNNKYIKYSSLNTIEPVWPCLHWRL